MIFLFVHLVVLHHQEIRFRNSWHFLKFCSVTEVTYFYSQRCYDYCLSSTFVYYLQKPDIKMHFFKFHLIYIPKCMCWQSFSFVFWKLSKLQAPYKVAVTKKGIYRENKLQALTKTNVRNLWIEWCTDLKFALSCSPSEAYLGGFLGFQKPHKFWFGVWATIDLLCEGLDSNQSPGITSLGFLIY